MENTDLDSLITHLSHSIEKGGEGSLKPYPFKYNMISKRGLHCIARLFLEFSPRTSEDRNDLLARMSSPAATKTLFDSLVMARG
jgi:hypothetical protein